VLHEDEWKRSLGSRGQPHDARDDARGRLLVSGLAELPVNLD
jgi:hypothetical protein